MHNTSEVTKPNYGIDTPGLIRNFTLAGIVAVLASLLFTTHSPSLSNSLVEPVLFWGLFLGGLYSLINAGLMIYSSKKGKIKLIQQIVSEMNWKGQEKVLNVGCGRGLLLNEVAKKLSTGKVTGIDIWNKKNQPHQARERILENAASENIPKGRIEIMTADVRSMPFRDNSFDVVVSSLTLHDIKNPEERKKGLNEISRVLKPGGQLMLLDYLYTDQYVEHLEKIGWVDIHRSELRYQMFPPVRIVSGTKPIYREDDGTQK